MPLMQNGFTIGHVIYSVIARFNLHMGLRAWDYYRDIIKKGCILNLLGNFEKAGEVHVLKQTSLTT